MLRRILIAALATAALLVPANASGVWGGGIDTSYPQVGAMYFDFEGAGTPVLEGLVCSGSYAGPSRDGDHDVFLTAGHCLPPAAFGIPASALYVSFSNNAGAPGLGSPVSSPIQVEEYHQMPGFGRNLGDLRDIGVLLLPADSVPSSIPAVEIAPAGYLDDLKRDGTLKFREIGIAGYGAQPVWEPAGPTGFFYDAKRRSATSKIIGLGKAFVHFTQNNGVGTGSGLCFGDSGSPQIDLADDVVVSVTSGGNGQCNANNYDYRVDTPLARQFLGQFLDLS